LWVWGRNNVGQLGLGDYTDRYTPTQVGTEIDWVGIAAGVGHSLALKSDGTLWAWGNNFYGQLGLGDNANRTIPTQVGTSTDWVKSVYFTSGTFTSQVIDVGQNVFWGTIDWSDYLPSGTNLAVKVRTCDDSNCIGEQEFNTLPNVNKGQDISSVSGVLDGQRYIQFQITFSTANDSLTPEFNDLTLNYSYYPASGTLISSSYNTSDPHNILAKILWSQILPSPATTIKFQVRTSPDGSTWTPWCGPDDAGFSTSTCSTTTYFTDPSGGQIMDEMFTDGTGDQWIQYKAILETNDNLTTPILDEVTLIYVVNAPPEFDPSQPPTVNVISSSNIQINYSVRDIDTDNASPQNQWKLWPSFEYSLDGGNTWYPISTTTLTGPHQENPINLTSTSTFLSTTTIWNAKALIDGTYSSNARIRIILDDHEAANNITITTTPSFILDTKDPRATTTLDVSQNVFNLIVNDESVIDYRCSSSTDFSNVNWQTNLTNNVSQSIPIVLSSDIYPTVYCQIRDAYNNLIQKNIVAPHQLTNFKL
jgi:hypothetical protein